MPIALPPTMFGFGLIVYYLFFSATHALPLLAGLAAGFGASALGASPAMSFAMGAITALFTIAAGRFAGLTVRSRTARIALHMAHALPAAAAGYALVAGLATLSGFGGAGVIVAPVAALACALVAAQRLSQPA